MIRHSQGRRAFSLMEVIIAAGLFGSAVTVIIALLPALARQGGESVDSLSAQRVPDALRSELVRLSGPGIDALAAQVPEMSGTLAAGLALVADRGVARLHSQDYLSPVTGQLPVDERYFLIECWRFPDEPLRFSAPKGFLALMVRVSWPHRLPGASGPVMAAARHEMLFTVTLNR